MSTLEVRVEILEDHQATSNLLLNKINDRTQDMSTQISGWTSFTRGVALLAVICTGLIGTLFWDVVNNINKTIENHEKSIAQLQSEHTNDLLTLSSKVKALEIVVYSHLRRLENGG